MIHDHRQLTVLVSPLRAPYTGLAIVVGRMGAPTTAGVTELLAGELNDAPHAFASALSKHIENAALS